MCALNIVIPMKDPRQAKQRLKPVLSDTLRQHLALSLFENCLHFFQSYFADYHLTVVTPSAMIASLTRAYHYHALIESSDSRGLNQALAQASDWSHQQGFQAQLILPADIADLRLMEMQTLLNKVSEKPSVVIVPSQDGGTNALLTTPVRAIPFAYGIGSAAYHQHSARARAYPCHRLSLAGLSHDIDMPSDLANDVGKHLLSHLQQPIPQYIEGVW